MRGSKAKALRRMAVQRAEHIYLPCFWRLKDVPSPYQIMRATKTTSHMSRVRYLLDANGKQRRADWGILMRRKPDSARSIYQQSKRTHRHVSPDSAYHSREWVQHCARVLREVRDGLSGARA